MAKAAEIYTWSGTSRTGRAGKGEISASSLQEAKNLLRRQGVSATKVKKLAKPLFGNKDKVTAQDIAVLSRQLATMLGAGVTLIQSLEMIGQGHSKISMRDMLAEITNEVKSGNPLSYALRKHPEKFDDLYCDLVETGEQSGALETIYDRIALYKEKAEALKSKIKKAMFYPIAVVTVAFIVTTILLIFVVPQFEEIFAGFGAELPVFTQFVIGLSNMMQDYGPFIAAGLFAAAVLFKKAHGKSLALRDSVDKKIVKIPVIGDILRKAAVARFARTLSTTFAAGVPLIGALDSADGASGNAVFRKAILFVQK
jgi:type IV pilus assembly protein PilC